MIQVLEKSKSKVPFYLKQIPMNHQNWKKITLQMYCYWSGEVILGNLEGVISTTAGHLNVGEVVIVEYDEKIINEKKFNSLDGMKVVKNDFENFRKCKKCDQKYYLENKFSNWEKIISNIQATKVNAALKNGESWEIYLSLKQIESLNKILKN